MKYILFIAIILFSSPCLADKGVLYLTDNSVIEYEGKTIYIGGEITHEVANIFTRINPKRFKIISLHSWGGIVSAAIRIAVFVHKNKLKTYVDKNRGCYSSCTVIFQAGETRIAHKTAKFMYHYAHSIISEDNISAIHTYRLFFKLVEYGVPMEFLSKWPKNGGLLNLTAQQTIAYNIVQKVID